jgi:hypothetical protein
MASADDYAAWIVKNQDKKGTPDFDTVAKAYQEAKSAEALGGVPGPRAARPASTRDVIASAPFKGAAGMVDIVLTAPQNVANLAKMAYGTGMAAIGRPELAPEVTAPRQPVAEMFTRAGLIREPEGELTPFQRVADVALQAATGGVLGSPSAIRAAAPTILGKARAAGRVAGAGAAAGGAGQVVTEATDQPLLGLATSVAVPTLSVTRAQARQAQAQAEQQRNAVRDLTVRQAQSEGFITTPGSVTPSTQNIMLERLAGKTRTQQEMTVRNQQVTDRLARRAVGIGDTDPLTRANMRQVRQDEFAKGYEPLNRIGTVSADTQFNQALDNVLTAFTGPGKSFPSAIPKPVQELVDSYRVGNFNSADAIQATRKLRESARANLDNGDNELGLAQRAISNALEDQIERQLARAGNANAQAMLDQFRASRQRMAVSHSIEDAIVEGGGSVNARQLANDLQTRGKYFSGDLDLIAKFANISRPVMVPPGTTGTPSAQTMMNTFSGNVPAAAGLGAGGYAVFGLPGLTAAAIPYAPAAISAAARQYLQSPFAQQRIIPQYNRPGVNALAASDPALLGALAGIPVATNQPQSANALAR